MASVGLCVTFYLCAHSARMLTSRVMLLEFRSFPFFLELLMAAASRWPGRGSRYRAQAVLTFSGYPAFLLSVPCAGGLVLGRGANHAALSGLIIYNTLFGHAE